MTEAALHLPAAGAGRRAASPAPVLLDWTAEKARAFGGVNLTFRHELQTRPMFSDAGLAAALDAYPRDRLGVFTMGSDPVDWRSWRRGSAGALSGAQLLAAVAEGRIWLNLRAANEHLPDYAALSDEIFADKERHARVRAFKRDVGLLISSPGAQVFYHLDTPLVSLWQIRGEKRVWLYPPEAPFVWDAQLEQIVLRETAEQFAYLPEWDAAADVVDLTPGRMVTWKQNAPHRIENGPMVNVSLSLEFMTPRAIARANMIYGAGVLRRRLGLVRPIRDRIGPEGLGLIAAARAAKALKLQAGCERVLPVTFRLDPGRPGRLIEL
jgi:hypothetical protein